MLTEDLRTIQARAQALGGELIEGDSEVGGGSFPGAKLKSWLAGFPDQRLAEKLRANDPRSLRASPAVACYSTRAPFSRNRWTR